MMGGDLGRGDFLLARVRAMPISLGGQSSSPREVVMPLFGQCFLSDVLKNPVLDPRGDIAGRLKDVLVVKGEPLAKVAAILVSRNRRSYLVPWREVEMFNRRILSIRCEAESIQSYQLADEDLLAVRDILDKQIVDANGAKVVRVNDVRLEGYNGEAVPNAGPVGGHGVTGPVGGQTPTRKSFWQPGGEQPPTPTTS